MKKSNVLIFMIVVSVLAIIFAFAMQSCTENQKARNYGGTETFRLEPGQKLLNATWKGEKGSSNLWYLTRPMKANETADTLYFKESSDYGVWQGTVVFIESKK
jgi:hypothetical protein